MKKTIAILLVCVLLLSGCSQSAVTGPSDAADKPTNELVAIPSAEPVFIDFSDPALLQYVNDLVYAGLVEQFDSENYIIEGVESVYISQEYLGEVAYNSQSNIFFGYTLKDINELYQGNKYVFTLGEDGSTTVRPFEDYDDTYDRVIKNVAVGTGVILICVTVSVVTGGAGVAPVSLVFAASAKTATAFALSSSAIGAISAGIIEAVRTGDTDAVVESAALAASEGFKWGAISGAFVGGVKEACAINRAKKAIEGAREVAQGTVDVPVDEQPWRQAELRALNEQGGYEQLSYLNGKQVPFGTQGATRPDVVRIVGDHIEAVEVKYYNLESPQSLNTLYNELTREVSARVTNLPAGSTQRIVLDVTGRGFSLETCEAVRDNIWNVLKDIYPNIPIDIVGLV